RVFGLMATALWKRSSPIIAEAGFTGPMRFYGITQTGFLDFEALMDIVGDLQPGVSEIMCHPGYVDDELKTMPTRLLSQREKELQLLLRPDVHEAIRRSNIELISYKDLAEDYGSRDADAVLDRYSAL